MPEVFTRLICHADNQVALERSVEQSARSHHPTETNSQQPTLESDRSALSQDILDKTERIAALETEWKSTSRELAAAHGLATTAERERSRADQRLKSQDGRLRVAERRIQELNEANKQARENMEARRALEHQLNSLLRRSWKYCSRFYRLVWVPQIAKVAARTGVVGERQCQDALIAENQSYI